MLVANRVWEAMGPSTLGDVRGRQRWAELLATVAADPAASVANACAGDWAVVVVRHDSTAIRVQADQRPEVGPFTKPEIRGIWLHARP